MKMKREKGKGKKEPKGMNYELSVTAQPNYEL